MESLIHDFAVDAHGSWFGTEMFVWTAGSRLFLLGSDE